MIWYLLIFSDSKKAVGYAYNMMGLTVKLAQSVSETLSFNNPIFVNSSRITYIRSVCVRISAHFC